MRGAQCSGMGREVCGCWGWVPCTSIFQLNRRKGKVEIREVIGNECTQCIQQMERSDCYGNSPQLTPPPRLIRTKLKGKMEKININFFFFFPRISWRKAAWTDRGWHSSWRHPGRLSGVRRNRSSTAVEGGTLGAGVPQPHSPGVSSGSGGSGVAEKGWG